MNWIIDIINTPTVISWIVYGITALIVFLAAKWLKIKIDSKKLKPIVEKIISWILAQTLDDNKPGLTKHNEVAAIYNTLPEKDKKLASKYLGADPVKKIYETVPLAMPSGKKSDVWKTITNTSIKTVIPFLIGGLAKKIF